MTLEQWASLGDIVAAGAVVASLIYLGVNEGQRSLEEKVKTNMWLTLFMRQREYE